MKYFVVLIISLALSQASGLADERANCDCNHFPWEPDSCVDVCGALILSQASEVELRKVMHLNGGIAERIIELRQSRPNEKFDSLAIIKSHLPKSEYKKVVQAIASLKPSEAQDILRHPNTGPIRDSGNNSSIRLAGGDIVLGRRVTADGSIPDEDVTDSFSPRESVYVNVRMGELPAGSRVRVVVLNQSGEKLSEEVKSVPAGEGRYLSFETVPSENWSPGAYQVEIWVDDEKLMTEDFQISEEGM